MSVELPKDAEGREIPLDTVALYDDDGNKYEVDRYCYSVRQSIPERVWEAVMLDSLTYYTSRLYLTQPDSWEKLLDDLDKAASKTYCATCTYFGKNLADCYTCSIGDISACDSDAMRDIASRVRKLRGEGE